MRKIHFNIVQYILILPVALLTLDEVRKYGTAIGQDTNAAQKMDNPDCSVQTEQEGINTHKNQAAKLATTMKSDTDSAKIITKGFVFIDGVYIDAPYQITTKGGSVYVNGKRIKKYITSKRKEYSGDDDPKMPDNITKYTSIYDEAFGDYIRRKIAYVQKHYTREQECRIMESVYRSLPFVKEAHLDAKNPRTLHIITFKGERDSIGLISPRRRASMSASELAEADKINLEKRLPMGDCYFFFSRGGHITCGEGRALEILPKLIAVLKSNKPEKEKFEGVRKAGLEAVNKDTFSSLVTNFSASPQLEERLNKLLNKPNDKEDKAQTMPANGAGGTK